jgi:septum formation protein
MNNQLVLASDSPRRKELLLASSIPFTTVSHGFDEESLVRDDPVLLAQDLALGKAESVTSLPVDSIVLGVDTIVVCDNTVLGKPADEQEALRFMELLSGREHQVISGLALITRAGNLRYSNHSISTVHMGQFNTMFLKKYIKEGHWKGFAGGYAIQGLFSLVVQKIEGSYTNIVGMPMELLYKILLEIGYEW